MIAQKLVAGASTLGSDNIINLDLDDRGFGGSHVASTIISQ
jgi:hypothetical protein